MFNINKTGSTYYKDGDKKGEIKTVSWKDSHLFFRFGYFRYVKFNAYQSVSEYLKMRQRDK